MKNFIEGIIFIVIFVLSGNVFSEENKLSEIQEPSKVAKDNSLKKKTMKRFRR